MGYSDRIKCCVCNCRPCRCICCLPHTDTAPFTPRYAEVLLKKKEEAQNNPLAGILEALQGDAPAGDDASK